MKYQGSSLVLHVRHRLLVHRFVRPQFGHFIRSGPRQYRNAVASGRG